MTRRRAVTLAAAADCVVVLAFLGARAWFFGDGEIRVGDLVSNTPALGDVTDITAEYCAHEIGCTEAWQTSLGVYMQFDSENEARHWGEIFGDGGAQWKTFVLDARERELSADERVTAVQILLSYDGV